MKSSRSVAVIAGLVVALVATFGVTSPASAQYSNEPLTLAWQADGPIHSSLGTPSSLYVGGLLFGGTGGVAALDPATGALQWSVTTNGDVRAMALSSDGTTLFVGGGFSVANGVTHRHLAAINIADGTVLPKWKAAATGMVRDLVVTGDTLFVGGAFGKIGGVDQKGLGALTASTGKLIPAFAHHTDRNVDGLAITGNTLIAVGNFTLIDGTQRRSSLASFNLTTYALNSWAPRRLCNGCNSYWDVQTDGTNAYVGTSGFGGHIAAFNLVTGNQPWHDVFTDGDVQTVYLAPDGLLYVGGHFGQFVGSTNNPRTLMAAVNPSNGFVDQNFHPRFFELYPGVWTITSTPGALFGGGDFNGVGTGPNETNNHVPFLAGFGLQ